MRLFLAGCAATALASFSVAHAQDKSNGCGLGWMVAKDQSLISTTTRGVTNAFLPNTFSMTFGTSGCAKHSIVHNDKRGLHFVEANAEALEVDVAAGSGQYLEGLAASLGCSASVQGRFAETLRGHYDEIYASGDEDTTAVYSRMKAVLTSDAEIKSHCLALDSQA